MKWDNFTAGRISGFQCKPGSKQTIFWDGKTPGLGVRVMATGTKSFIFETSLNGKTIRITIGDVATWSISDAQAKATGYKAQTDDGIDPRAAKLAAAAAETAAQVAADAARMRESLIFGDVWAIYLEDRKPYWGDRHYRDHIGKIAPGGVPKLRGTRGRGVTVAGPLYHFADMPLSKINAEVVEEWSKREGALRPTSARLAWRMLKVFFQWCAEHKTYVALIPDLNPGKTKRSREYLGQVKSKKDNIESAQLPAWFDAVQKIGNLTVSAYLQTLLLTGARPGEVLAMKWGDINWRWGSIIMRDKVEGDRTIPLTPYVEHLLVALPKREGNEHVFSSAQVDAKIIASPNAAHHAVCQAAGIDPVTLHGLRRSFASLTAQMDIAGGVSMQIQGHKPVSSREKSYIIWPLDFLKKSHRKIEVSILELAGMEFTPAPAGLRVVATK